MLTPLFTIRKKHFPIFLLPYPTSKIVYINRGQTIQLTHDDLFSHYTEFIPLLSPLYFHDLPFELQEVVRHGGYILPDLSSLATSHSQEQDLQILCEHAVIVFEFFTEENRRIRQIMNILNNECDTFQVCWLILIILALILSKLFNVTQLLTSLILHNLL